jgi:SAM-dependent methyltransferase
MVQKTDYTYSGSELLAVGEQSLANYNEWIVRQFIRYFRKSDLSQKSVLDFGAGIGTLAVLFAKETGTHPIAIEVDAEQQVILRRRNFETYASLDALNRSIDFVYTSNVLEHIEDDVATIAALRDRLPPGGKIAIFVPAFESIWSHFDDQVGHLRRYTIASLSETLVTAGFEIDSIKYCDSLGFLLAFLFKFLGSASGEPGGTSLKIFDRFVFPISLMIDKVTGHFFGKNVMALARRK